MLQLTLKRLENLPKPIAPPIIVCNEEHRFIVAEQLRQLNIKNASIILEPYAKNTAPAIALAALQGLELYPEHDTILLVLAVDHFIDDIECFEECVKNAYHYATQNDLAIFGVVPTEANTGYGYIQLEDEIKKNEAYKLKQFIEKPDRSTAEKYLSTNQYLWNSGMFMFRSIVILEELKKYQDEIYQSCVLAWQSKKQDMDFIRVNADIFQ